MINLYDSFEKNFTHNGIKVFDEKIDFEKAEIKRSLKGVYDVELTILKTNPKASFIKCDMILKIPTTKGKNDTQLFRVKEIKEDSDSFEIYAQHIFFDLADAVIVESKIVNEDGQTAINHLLNDVYGGTRFSGKTDILSRNSLEVKNKTILEALFDGDDSFVKVYGGEVDYDNFSFSLNKKVGKDNNVAIRYGKNLTNSSINIDTSNVATRIFPIGGDDLILPEKFVDSPLINNYATPRVKKVTFNDVKVDDKLSEEEAYEKLREKSKELFEDGADKPKVTIDVDFINLKGYTDNETLASVDIGDIVYVYLDNYSDPLVHRVVEYKYDLCTDTFKDCIINNTQDSILAEINSNSNKLNKIEEVFTNKGDINSEHLEGAIDLLKVSMKGMVDSAEQHKEKAILFEDRVKGSSTYGAMAIGTKGFLIASERTSDDKDWNWRTFGTGKGFLADCITAGVLKGCILKSLGGELEISLDQSNDGMVFYQGSGNNKKKTIQIDKTKMTFYDWATGTKNAGNICTVQLDSNPETRGLCMANSKETYSSISYETTDAGSDFNAYILFDKYNNHKNSNHPISFWQDADMMANKLYFNEAHIYKSDSGRLANIAPTGWGVFKDSKTPLLHIPYDNSEVICEKNFRVKGTKNCIQKTKSFGERLYYATEDAESYLTDNGKGTLIEKNKEGEYYTIITMDPIFKESIEAKDYHVFLTKYGRGDLWVDELREDEFVVKGENPISFSWEIKGHRKGYEGIRLEEFREN